MLIGAVLFMAAALCCWSSVIPGLAGEKDPATPQSPPAPHAPAAITLSEIAARAAEVSSFLQDINAHLVPAKAVQDILTQLPALRLQIDREFPETNEMLQTEAILDQLQAKEKVWQERRLLVAGWLKTLTERATRVKTSLDHLAERQRVWTATHEAVRASNAPLQIIEQVEAVSSSLGAVRIPLEVQLKDTLDLQAAVARQVSRCESMFAQIVQAQQRAMGGFLTRDAPPFWNPELWEQAGRSLSHDIPRIVAAGWRGILGYVGSASSYILLHAGLFLTAALLFGAAGRKLHRLEASGSSFPSSEVLDHPWSAAYLVCTVLMTGPMSPAPEMVKRLLGVAAFLPMTRLVAPMGPRVILGTYFAGVLFALESLRYTFAGIPWLEQSLIITETLAGIVILARLKARGHFEPLDASIEHTAFHHIFRAGRVLMLAGLALGLLAGILGYMRLARLFASTSVDLGYLVLLFYCLMRIAMGLVAFSLSTWPLGNLRMVQHHRELLLLRAQRLMVWLAILTGILRSLDHLGLFQPTLVIAETILTTKLERGAFSLSLGDVLGFGLTVWAAYVLSAFIRFALREDVYPRLGVPVGLSYAASSLLNYVILSLGVVVGLAVLGVNLTRVTVLAGALGVGIGFGLQSVVNNFVSGLILLFERPIHVGDSIEVGDNLGEVRRIGIRASTIRTRQGAEIIIPNAQLVTDRVTNWTLSDQLRRLDVPVGVNYGAPPKEVIQMLERVARNHPRVMRVPPPQGLFVGFGDSSLNFELRAWTDEFADWARIRSDLAVAIHDGVAEAGWTIPFPQREVRILKSPQ
jgi:small-conductance mechanosensitive channel